MKKIIVVGFIIIIGLTAILFIPKESKKIPQKDQKSEQTITVSEKITTQQQTKQFVTIQIQKGKSALDLLNKTTTIQTKGAGQQAFVVEINNVKAEDSKKQFWAFYVNGKQAGVGAGSYILKPNDKIEWKIETY